MPKVLPAMDFLRQLGMTIPIIQAPMGGGATTPQMVAAVSSTGALGTLAAAYLTAEQIEQQVASIRHMTDRPFGINLFSGGWSDANLPEGFDAQPMLDALGVHHQRLGIEGPKLPSPVPDPYPAQFEAVVQAKPAFFSSTFGLPSETDVERLHRIGTVVLGTATTVQEALALKARGVDAVIVQGAEAGAHRGTFLGPWESSMIGTLALVPQAVDALVGLPVIAAGGVMDGRGLAAVLCLGACAAQMGTAFLTCDESGVAEVYKKRVMTARDDSSRITLAFSGRPARGLVNEFMERADAIAVKQFPYPLQNAATRAMRSAATKANDGESLSLWAGQAACLARSGKAADLVLAVQGECEKILECTKSH